MDKNGIQVDTSAIMAMKKECYNREIGLLRIVRGNQRDALIASLTLINIGPKSMPVANSGPEDGGLKN